MNIQPTQNLEDHVRDLTKMIEQREKIIPKWINVDDPPKKSGRYLVLFEDGHCCDAEYDANIDDGWRFGEYHALYDSQSLGFLEGVWSAYEGVTHWMPIPKPYEGNMNAIN